MTKLSRGRPDQRTVLSRDLRVTPIPDVTRATKCFNRGRLGSVIPGSRALAQLAGFDHHLTKPIDPAEIAALIDGQ
jgi:hypothetical protein